MGAELIGAIDWSSWAGTAVDWLKVAVGLGFVIFVHELGHFLVAKFCGVKCEKFYIGFDIPMPFGLPSKLYRIQWGETEYGIGILPLGGYVKMLGQDDNPLNAEEEAERTKLPASPAASPAAKPAPAKAPVPRTVTIDPRSYTAKTVPQRMAIISAGVIVNLIFAVIFAAAAYRVGVSITPCKVGQVLPGGPAWKAGLQPNTRIVQIGEQGKRSDKLRFDWDLRQGVGLHGDQADLALVVQDSYGKESTVSVRPVTFQRGWEKLSSIGIAAEGTLELLRKDQAVPAMEESAAARAKPPLQNRDRVVAVDGRLIRDQYELTAYMAQHVDGDLKLQVERPATDGKSVGQIVEVVVPPQSRRTVGVIMEYGPITGIRPGSPADLAGLREGDLFLSLHGEPLGDPLLLPHQLRSWYGQEIEITVKRPSEPQPVTVKATPVPPTTFDWEWPGTMPNAPMTAEALGVAFSVSSVVKEVVPDSPAAKAGIQAGDKLVALQVQSKKESSQRDSKTKAKEAEEVKIDNEMVTWPVVTQVFQHIAADESISLTYQRGNSVGTAVVTPQDSEVTQPDRGFVFASYSEIHAASSFSEAVYLGLRQTWEDATRVVGLLRKLVTGSVSVTNLGGLGSIAYVASSEASEGLPRLLIFLTMLSANLAVLNFLPIPALDGGHMMFLLYEGLFRKPVNERVQVALTIFGVACLLGLMIFVNALDVKRFFF